jgi:hypothetical protein
VIWMDNIKIKLILEHFYFAALQTLQVLLEGHKLLTCDSFEILLVDNVMRISLSVRFCYRYCVA